MNYDDWKQATPDSYDYEENNECGYCGSEIKDGEEFCSTWCKKGYLAD